jgi:hypothetical protein
MRFFRLSPPCGWTVALVLFFFPWVDVSCRGKNGSDGRQAGSFSGIQLALGGVTRYDLKGKLEAWTLIDLPEATKTSDRIAALCLLSAYAVGLIAGIYLGFRQAVGRRRALFGGVLGILFIGLLVASFWILFGKPFWAPPPAEFSDDSIIPGLVVDFKYTVWYYASYAANLWSVGSFVVVYLADSRSQKLAA